MVNNVLEIVLLFDRSGSMEGLERKFVCEFNSLIRNQKTKKVELYVTVVLFDDRCESVYERIPISEIIPLNYSDYYVRGCSALFDAIGKTVNTIGNIQKHLPNNKKSSKVLFIILSDGFDNASKQYGYKQISDTIYRQKKRHGWEFYFCGMNTNCIKEANLFEIESEKVSVFYHNQDEIRKSFIKINNIISKMRKSIFMDDKI